jgi:hypothetical protein
MRRPADPAVLPLRKPLFQVCPGVFRTIRQLLIARSKLYYWRVANVFSPFIDQTLARFLVWINVPTKGDSDAL